MKKLYLVLVALLLAVMLSACGGSATNTPVPAATSAPQSGGNATAAPAQTGGDIPVVSGASTTAIPDMLKTALDGYKASVPGGTVEAYKVSGPATKIKTDLAAGFKSKGWEDKTASLGAQATAALEQSGGFYLLFQKGTKAAAVVGYPGTLAGLGANDVIYFVVSGGQ
jgi:hypothetical protein